MSSENMMESLIEEHITLRARQLNPYGEQPQFLAEEAAIEELKRDKKPELLNGRERYQEKADELNKIFGDYTNEDAKFFRDYRESEHITEVPYGENILDELRKQDDPVLSALYFWVSKSEKGPLLRMVDEFPDKRERLEQLTQWIYYNRALENNDPFVRVYRAVEHEYNIRPLANLGGEDTYGENELILNQRGMEHAFLVTIQHPDPPQ